MKFPVVITYLLLLLSPAAAGLELDELVRAGITSQLRADYKAADEIADRLQKIAPDNGASEELRLNTLITRLSWDPAITDYDSGIRQTAARALEICEARMENGPARGEVLNRCGQANFALAFLNGMRGKMYTAGVQGSQAINYFEAALDADPAFVDAKLQLGMAYYYADNLPPVVKVISNFLWFIPTGNSEKSLPYIRDVIERGQLLGDVARFVYSDLAQDGEDTDPMLARELLDDLIARYPSNPRYHLAQINLLMNAGLYEGALAAANQGLANHPTPPDRAFLMELWRIQANLALGNNSEAVQQFKALAEPPDTYPRWGRSRYFLVKAQIADVSNDRAEAIAQYQNAIDAIGRYHSPRIRAAADAGLSRQYATD